MDTAEVLRRARSLRMRAALMTALVPSLGFVTMALATGSRAILTLFILPAIYSFTRRQASEKEV